MKKLSISGHSTRGKEVIEILEMLGGTNRENCWGVFENRSYLINAFGDIEDRSLRDKSNYQIYTLEEFLEKFPYKVGDKVKIAKTGNIVSIEGMSWRNETCEVVYETCYNNDCVAFYSAIELQDYQEFISEQIFTTWKKYSLPEGYEFHDDKGNVINTSTIELVKKQPEYPKTIIEVLNFWHPDRQLEDDYQRCYKKDLIEKFQDLLYARDAYWKIAGEQMGLGKPWKQDYNDRCFVIANNNGNIHTYEYHGSDNVIFAFPTKEMRDAFYENFKELFESCKEFL